MEDTEHKIISPFDTSRASWKDVLKNLAVLALIIGIIYLFARYIGFDNIRDAVEKSGPLAPLVIIILKATTIVIVPLGGTPLYPIAGALFGFWGGLGITLIGDALGSTVAFFLSKYFGQKIFRFLMPQKYLPLIDNLVIKLGEAKTFLKARIFFTGFPELFAYASGLTKVPFLTFLTIHIGIHVPFNALLVSFGDLIISGNILVVTISAIITTGLALAGMWWFHANLSSGS